MPSSPAEPSHATSCSATSRKIVVEAPNRASGVSSPVRTSAYRAINWQTLELIVGMLPFSLALQRTGGVDLAADALLAVLGESSPRLVMAVILVIAAIIGLFISNTATAILMAPVLLPP